MSLSASYNQVRAHHVLIVGVAYKAATLLADATGLSAAILGWMSKLSESVIPLIHAGIVPDFLIRYGIRVQLRNHLQQLKVSDVEAELSNKLAIVKQLTDMPIAVATDEANDQHYEVPAAFYDLCWGP